MAVSLNDTGGRRCQDSRRYEDIDTLSSREVRRYAPPAIHRFHDFRLLCGGVDALTAHCPLPHASLSACGLFLVFRQMSSATLYVQYF